MPKYNDEGIVLNSYEFQENDKLVSIYTRQGGLIRAIGKGARKSVNKFGARLDKLSCSYFQFSKGKNLDIINECRQINLFSSLKKDLIRLTYGILFLEVVNNFAFERESESTKVYDLLYFGLDNLQFVDDTSSFSVDFFLSFLSVHGFKPQLETCVYCSQQVNSLTAKQEQSMFPYSSILGGLLCRECSQVIDHKVIRTDVLQMLKEDSEKMAASRENIRQALDLLREHIDIRAKKKIKSFDLVFSL